MATVLLTRPEEDAVKDRDIFQSFGFKVNLLPLIGFKPLDFEIPPLENFDYIYFGSKRGVKYFFQKLDREGIKKLPPIVVVGKKTAQFLEEFGLKPFLVLDGYSNHLVELAKSGKLKKGKVLIPTSKVHTKDIYRLKDIGFEIKVLPVYETVYLKYPSEVVRKKLEDSDIVIFTSPSTFFSLVENLQNGTNLLREKIIVAIGKTTAKAVEGKGFKVSFTPSRPDMGLLAKELAEAVNGIDGKNFKR
jgi:uroporphyrinogen-III synthase